MIIDHHLFQDTPQKIMNGQRRDGNSLSRRYYNNTFSIPVGFRKISLERHQYDNHDLFHHQKSAKTENVSVVTIRRSRKSQFLVAFLMVLCQFAAVDDINLLPAGIIMYAFGITFVIEQLTTPDDTMIEIPLGVFGMLPWFQDGWKEHQQMMIQRQRELEFKQAYDSAMFEYHVLRGRNNVKIIPIAQDGKTVLYAI